MRIFVQNYLGGDNFILDVASNDTVAHVKSLIEGKTSVPKRYIRLIHGSKQLVKDSEPLRDYHFPAQDDLLPGRLQALLRLAGGKGGFGSLLRGAGKHKLADSNDDCRDLQGRRIRQKKALENIEEWNSRAHERQLETIALQHIKDRERARKKCQEEVHVSIDEVKEQQKEVVENVADSVKAALRAQKSRGKKKRVVSQSERPSSESDNESSEEESS